MPTLAPMRHTSFWYRAAINSATILAPAIARFNPKLREGLRGREGVQQRLSSWAASHRDPSRPLVWFHAPSVGEGLQAEAVITRLGTQHTEWQFAYTYFSPSAMRLAARLPVAIADYLPFDTARAVDGALDALKPTALVFSKLDLWPELAVRAANHRVRVAMIAATVSATSGRTRWPIRSLLRPGYAVLDQVGAIARDDADQLVRLGVRKEALSVTGDPRYDSALSVVQRVDPLDPLLAFGKVRPTLVAGSTWPSDEAVLLRAFRQIGRIAPAVRLILVPHEPTPAHLERLEAESKSLGLGAPTRLSTGAGPEDRLLVVDRLGDLATLYGGAAFAFVGGGFGQAGLHSVLEPAAWGVPVVFGPAWQGSRDAGLLLRANAAYALRSTNRDGAAAELADLWMRWTEGGEERGRTGRAALEVVTHGLGAADRNAALVERLVLEATNRPT